MNPSRRAIMVDSRMFRCGRVKGGRMQFAPLRIRELPFGLGQTGVFLLFRKVQKLGGIQLIKVCDKAGQLCGDLLCAAHSIAFDIQRQQGIV